MESFEEEEVLGKIDRDNFSGELPDSDTNNVFDLVPHLTPDSQPIDDSSVPSWIGEVETLLMKDDEDDKVDQLGSCVAFLADISVDSPSNQESGGEVLDADGGPEKGHGVEGKNKDGEEEDPDDPDSKKRRRQFRNRDAAVRSREWKKMYVRDLEIKSRYLEEECRRLHRLLHCFIAENHALRLSLPRGSAFGDTSTKQESAVLLLESLLLGSLLWFLSIVCLFTQPAMPLVAVLLVTMVKKAPKIAAFRGAGSKPFISLANSRRCKASRPRMKLQTGVNLLCSEFGFVIKSSRILYHVKLVECC